MSGKFPPRKIVPRSGSGFGLGLALELGLGGNFPRTLKVLSKDCKNGVLKIGDDILTELKSKHPPAAEVKQDSLLFGSVNELFCKILLLFS